MELLSERIKTESNRIYWLMLRIEFGRLGKSYENELKDISITVETI